VAQAREILDRTHVALLATPDSGVTSAIAQIRIERASYASVEQLSAEPGAQEIETRRIWWGGPTLWRSETDIEYRRDGAPAEAEPGWLLGGVTVSDGDRVWTFSDVSPGVDPVTGETVGPVVHAQPRAGDRQMPIEMPLAVVFGDVSSPLSGGAGLEALLRNVEECFVAELDGTATVAGREAHVILLRPREVGKVETGPIAADSCHAALAHEPSERGGRVAEQTLALWIDSEHYFVLKAEKIVYLSGDAYPGVSLARSEVVGVQFDVEIDPERFTFTPPEGVEVIEVSGS
jgi:outer membrane lipoprotein-sorting protein